MKCFFMIKSLVVWQKRAKHVDLTVLNWYILTLIVLLVVYLSRLNKTKNLAKKRKTASEQALSIGLGYIMTRFLRKSFDSRKILLNSEKIVRDN